MTTRRFPNKPICPVCFQPVKSTSPVIRKHKNTIGRDCEASGEPFRIALTDHLRPPTGTA